jgi:hypothetical protein
MKEVSRLEPEVSRLEAEVSRLEPRTFFLFTIFWFAKCLFLILQNVVDL